MPKAGEDRRECGSPPARLKELIRVLNSTLVPFSERKQEFFCTVCRYRDPLGPDGNKLHADNCPLAAVMDAIDTFEHLPEWPPECGKCRALAELGPCDEHGPLGVGQ